MKMIAFLFAVGAAISIILFYRGKDEPEIVVPTAQSKKDVPAIQRSQDAPPQVAVQGLPKASKPRDDDVAEHGSHERQGRSAGSRYQDSPDNRVETIGQSEVLSDREGIRDFLERVQIPDFTNRLRSLRVVATDDFLRPFRGNFEGLAEVIHPNSHSAKMGLQMAIEAVNQKQQGRVYIELAKPGGDLRYDLPLRITELQRSPDDNNALYLTAVTGDGATTYFQIYYSPALDSVVGNIYREFNKQTQHIGTFSLDRI